PTPEAVRGLLATWYVVSNPEYPEDTSCFRKMRVEGEVRAATLFRGCSRITGRGILSSCGDDSDYSSSIDNAAQFQSAGSTNTTRSMPLKKGTSSGPFTKPIFFTCPYDIVKACDRIQRAPDTWLFPVMTK